MLSESKIENLMKIILGNNQFSVNSSPNLIHSLLDLRLFRAENETNYNQLMTHIADKKTHKQTTRNQIKQPMFL